MLPLHFVVGHHVPCRLSLSERRTLSKDLLNDLPQIRDDVQDAVDRGGPRAVINELVLAPGSEARRTVAGIRSVEFFC